MLNLVFNTLSVADATELNRELEIYYLISPPQKILNSSIERFSDRWVGLNISWDSHKFLAVKG